MCADLLHVTQGTQVSEDFGKGPGTDPPRTPRDHLNFGRSQKLHVGSNLGVGAVLHPSLLCCSGVSPPPPGRTLINRNAGPGEGLPQTESVF